MKRRVLSLLLSLVLTCSLCGAAFAQQAGPTIPLAPSALHPLEDGALLVADLYHRALWRQTPGQTPTLLAGGQGGVDLYRRPLAGYADGAADKALFSTPWAIAPYRDGWAVTDSENHVVRYLADGKVYTLAGTGSTGSAGGKGEKASFSLPTGLAAGPDGSLYVADTGNSAIRKIDADGVVTTWAGGTEGRADGALKEARFSEPTGLSFSGGVLYVCDSGNNRICKIENGVVSTLAGAADGVEGYQDGGAAGARFAYPQGVAVQGTDVYVADTGNGAVRLVRDGIVSTLCAPGSLAGGLYPVSPRALALSGGQLWVVDTFAQVLFSLDLSAAEPGTPVFSDVPDGAWYAEAVAQISRRGLMTGTGEGTFSPDAPLTRAMFVTLLSRLHSAALPSESIDGESGFPDVVPGAWYAAPAAWAADQGLIQGDGGRFYPHRALTRAELAVLLHRYTALLGGDTTSVATDVGQAPAWAAEALHWAVSAQLFAGDPAPARTATRAETAALLSRFLILVKL